MRGDLEHSLLKLDGIHDVVHKPINFSEIRDKVLNTLDKRRINLKINQ